MHRLALALGLTRGALDEMPASELRDWRQFDAQVGLPDIAAQWQRGLHLVAKAGRGAKLEKFIPMLAWNKPRGSAALLEALKNGEV